MSVMHMSNAIWELYYLMLTTGLTKSGYSLDSQEYIEEQLIGFFKVRKLYNLIYQE